MSVSQGLAPLAADLGFFGAWHAARINGQWKIVNVLWELKPENK